ncbi:SDR family NAD(P)-dependent oxidoreductase [Streptomyces albidoflavus]
MVISGGATGIGFGMAREFELHGAHVVLASRNEERLEVVRTRLAGLGVSCAVVLCDVRDEDAVARLVDETTSESGGIEVLVNNAAGNCYSPAETMSSRSFRTMIEIYLLGTFLCTRAVVPHMMEQCAGVVLNIGMTDPHRGMPASPAWQPLNPLCLHSPRAGRWIGIVTPSG